MVTMNPESTVKDPAAPSHPNKSDLITRLKKIEGQIRGIQRMVEDDSYCVDVLNQISAVVSAIERVGLRVLEDHIRGCVADALSGDAGEEKITELTQVLKSFLQVGHSAVATPPS